MVRELQKAIEHAEYSSEHTSKLNHAEEVSSLKNENAKLKKQVAKLKSELKLYKK